MKSKIMLLVCLAIFAMHSHLAAKESDAISSLWNSFRTRLKTIKNLTLAQEKEITAKMNKFFHQVIGSGSTQQSVQGAGEHGQVEQQNMQAALEKNHSLWDSLMSELATIKNLTTAQIHQLTAQVASLGNEFTGFFVSKPGVKSRTSGVDKPRTVLAQSGQAENETKGNVVELVDDRHLSDLATNQPGSQTPLTTLPKNNGWLDDINRGGFPLKPLKNVDTTKSVSDSKSTGTVKMNPSLADQIKGVSLKKPTHVQPVVTNTSNQVLANSLAERRKFIEEDSDEEDEQDDDDLFTSRSVPKNTVYSQIVSPGNNNIAPKKSTAENSQQVATAVLPVSKDANIVIPSRSESFLDQIKQGQKGLKHVEPSDSKKSTSKPVDSISSAIDRAQGFISANKIQDEDENEDDWK